MIKLSLLNKYYNKGRQNQVHAVNDITMTLPDRGMIAFFGKSGCGKTTLLNVIGGLDKASSGSVELDGKEIYPNADTERNLHIGYIFQNYNLSDRMTVYENVAASLRLCGVVDENEINERVLAALESVDMAKFRNRMPSALSGGQQQRVAIARAIVKNPSVILADEPTGNLDEQNTVMVMDLLKSIAKEKLVLLVTHEAHLVDSYCDKVIGISDGKVFEERENSVTEGYKGKKTNEVYLGDMDREELSDGGFTFEFFGERESKPTKIRIISAGGTLYVSADEGVKLKLADNSSELIVHEGKYEQKVMESEREFPEVLKKPISSTKKAGRMYGTLGAIKSGYKANFAKKKKRKKLLIAGMLSFSAVMVFFVAIFGTTVYNYMQVEQQYNSHAVAISALKMTDEEARELVSNGSADLFTIEKIYAKTNPTSVHDSFIFRFGSFETSMYSYSDGVENHNVYSLPESMLSERGVLVGKGTIENENEIIITDELADRIIETANVSTVKYYRELIYATVSEGYGYYYEDMYYDGGIEIAPSYSPDGFSNNKTYTIVGVVDGDDEEAFFDDYVYLQRKISSLYGISKTYISDLAHSSLTLPKLEDGSIYLRSGLGNVANDKYIIGGKDFKVADTFELEITDEMLSTYSQNYYGSDLTKGVEAYLEWSWGYPSFEIWFEESYGDEKDSDKAKQEYADFVSSTTNEYMLFMQDLRNGCIAAAYSTLPSIIMTENDMELISNAYSTGENAPANSLMANIYKGGHYVFYSKDPEALADKLIEKHGIADVVTPEATKNALRAEFSGDFAAAAIALGVVAAVLSLCMYFIMRSALLGDIKEVGISRAIGVSRRNLCYRYFIESMVLFVLTVFIGYLLASGLMTVIASISTGVMTIVYYPWWLALLALAGIFAITAACGQIPIRSLLRKTPAEILAKYDI
ncbi:MAG: ABC transporter ATP-binding protein/permease [Ruminococcaceae bacterium]|nr:ABC transporter ATP-binding protein/permease [Oscillospiraceae bacterium]